MNGGPRYWNEDTQRWEDGTGGTAPVTPPPPPRPQFLPPVPDGRQDSGTPTQGEQAGAGYDTWSNPELPNGGVWPPADPTAPVTRGPGRRLVWSVLGGAVAVGVAVALVLTQVVGDDGEDGGSGDDRAASVSASPSGGVPSGATETGTGSAGPADGASASPSDQVSGLPAGYELHTDAEGFTIALPLGWTRESVASQYGMDVVNYRSADGYRRLQVYEVAEASPEESFDLFLSDGTPKADGFEQVALEPFDDGGVTGMRLEYRADAFRGEPEVGSWHVQDVRFTAPSDGKVYAIAAYGPAGDGVDPELGLVLTAVAHFCPPDTICD
ncbi:hypothetical protein [Streptomyces sp. TRM68367]|uniref:hypothetical protein n=1 Tax=Streptomyces sp. TRM68367 TaxID=2758415 RepID=UPI00165C137E|nr:hypothetical protein [Streptomyces sp. TRM68367]MBC9731333.1 hypothetical protein [Streptomyces sp. TRM68367]